MEDSKIIELYFERAEMAISATDAKYGTYCMSIAYRILNQQEDSEECVSDTWLRAWDSIPPTKPNCLRTFLGKITRNLALNRLRDQKACKRGGETKLEPLDELRECVSDGCLVEHVVEQRLLTDSINRFLAELGQEKRVAFVLRYWYMYSTGEIAEKMQLSESKIRTMLFRLRKQLKTHLEQEGLWL